MVKEGFSAVASSVVSSLKSLIDINKVIVLTPLFIGAFFSLGYVQYLASEKQQTLQKEAAAAAKNSGLKPLPMLTQPVVPQLSGNVEIIDPPAPAYSASRDGLPAAAVGPSPTGIDTAIQAASGTPGAARLQELQPSAKDQKLNQARF